MTLEELLLGAAQNPLENLSPFAPQAPPSLDQVFGGGEGIPPYFASEEPPALTRYGMGGPSDLTPYSEPGFMARLGMGTRGAPPAHGVHGIDFLSGLIQGIGASGLGQFQSQQVQTEKSNEEKIKTHAAELASHRWNLDRAARLRQNAENNQRMREQTKAANDLRETIAANTRAGQDKIAADRLALDKDRAAETERHNREMEAMKGLIAGVSPDEEDVDSWRERLVTGQVEMSQVPVKIRTQVNTLIQQKGQRIIPKTARKAIDEVQQSLKAVDEMEAMWGTFGHGEGVGRIGSGAIAEGQAFLQSGSDAALYKDARKGLAGNLARAVSAERGVLTDRDRAYAMSLLPDIYTAGSKAAKNFKLLRDFLKNKEETALRVYTTAEPTSAGKPQAQSSGKAEWGRDANGKPVRIK